MPAWLVSMLVSLAIKVGVPWLIKRFPWIPPSVADVLDQLTNELKDPNKSNSAAKKSAIKKVRELGSVGFATDIKRN